MYIVLTNIYTYTYLGSSQNPTLSFPTINYAVPSLTPRSRTRLGEHLSVESKEAYGQRLNLVVHVSIR